MRNLPLKTFFLTLKSDFEIYKPRVRMARVRHLEEIIVHILRIEIDFRHVHIRS